MFDLETWWRDFQERPVLFPLLASYMKFMNIRRYEHMPFYFYPQGQKVVGFEDGVLRFLDFMVDAHELERNKQDNKATFYERANYVTHNFHRYSNDTMANLMFDTQLSKRDYDVMNSVIDRQTKVFYGAATLTHIGLLSWSSFFFRYRTLSKLQVLVAGTAYYAAVAPINNILYKLIVDQSVISQARRLGHDRFVQPNGTLRPRMLNCNY